MCSITPETVNVGSSYSHMRGPGVGCWLSDRSNCSHWSFEAAVLPINPNIYTDQWEPIVIYHSITLTGRLMNMYLVKVSFIWASFCFWLDNSRYIYFKKYM